MNWRSLGAWCAIYISLAIPLAILLGKLLHQATLHTIPALWVEPECHLPCLSCGGAAEIHWQEDGIWICCPACRNRLPAERYQMLMRKDKQQPTG